MVNEIRKNVEIKIQDRFNFIDNNLYFNTINERIKFKKGFITALYLEDIIDNYEFNYYFDVINKYENE